MTLSTRSCYRTGRLNHYSHVKDGTTRGQGLLCFCCHARALLVLQYRPRTVPLCISVRSPQSALASRDCGVLLVLYQSTDGPSWKNSANWYTDADLSDWHGVEVNGEGRVVELSLEQNNLQGIARPTLTLLSVTSVKLHVLQKPQRCRSAACSHPARGLASLCAIAAAPARCSYGATVFAKADRLVDAPPSSLLLGQGPPVSHISIPGSRVLLIQRTSGFACCA